MSKRFWKQEEDELLIREVKMGESLGINLTKIYESVGEKLGRTKASVGTRYWGLTHDKDDPTDRTNKPYRKGGRKVEVQPVKKDLTKMVIIPHEIADEINKVKDDENLRFNFDVFKKNPKYAKLGEWLGDLKNMELYSRAIINGFMPDKTPEEIIIERYTDPRSSGEYRDGIEFVLRKLSRLDIIGD